MNRIVHIINSFEFGGAEAMLCNLVLRHDRSRFEPFVVALIDDRRSAGPILKAGIPFACMRMKPGIPDPRGVIRLALHLRRIRPDVIQTWMDHSNLIGGIASRLASRAPLVWGVHHSNHVKGVAKRSTLATVWACGKLSHVLPHQIISCSEHSRKLYVENGFDDARIRVIPNGFDTVRFAPRTDARQSVRAELGLAGDAELVGLVARWDPCKDHANFLGAAQRLLTSRPQTRFVLCGADVVEQNSALMQEIDQRQLRAHCHLLGARHDVERIHAGMDVLVSSSITEAFPLVLGEAMACGVPCVATDVGDSRLIVGETGRIVPPSDPAALAAAIAELLAMSPEQRCSLGQGARQRVCDNFDLSAVTRRYEAVYDSVLDGSSLTVPGKAALEST